MKRKYAFVNQSELFLKVAKLTMMSLVALCIIVIALYFYGGKCTVCGEKSHVIHNYRDLIDLPEEPTREIVYDQIVELYGVPNSVECIPYETEDSFYRISLIYDSLTFHMLGESNSESEVWRLYGVEATDPSYHFNNNVHIGIPRWLIIWKYRHQIAIKYRSLGESYYEGGWSRIVEFDYDKNCRVSSITFWY